jgi:hypothetical protein
MPNSLPSDPALDARLHLLAESYRRLTGKPLIQAAATDAVSLRGAIWNAPFAIVAHGTEADPVFFYGNRYALQCFGMDFGEFTRLPSRLSAGPLAQAAREKLMAQVMQRGYVDGYSGMRIAKGGRQFMISNATVWNITDDAGAPCGQAAQFDAV